MAEQLLYRRRRPFRLWPIADDLRGTWAHNRSLLCCDAWLDLWSNVAPIGTLPIKLECLHSKMRPRAGLQTTVVSNMAHFADWFSSLTEIITLNDAYTLRFLKIHQSIWWFMTINSYWDLATPVGLRSSIVSEFINSINRLNVNDLSWSSITFKWQIIAFMQKFTQTYCQLSIYIDKVNTF